uniref:hypothetical protein n=1 Tax=Serratia proteamaculans TaxID=28151 RepID=UPI001F4BE0A3|nr:hypothetical protein [Serratia proteamaculans]
MRVASTKGGHQKVPGFCLAALATGRISGRAVKAAPASAGCKRWVHWFLSAQRRQEPIGLRRSNIEREPKLPFPL